MRSINIGVLWGTVYSGNQGVNALTYSIIHMLKTIADNNNININFCLIGTQNKDIHSGSISIKANTINYDFIPSKTFYLNRIYNVFNFKVFSKLKDIDIIFDLSQGDGFTDIYGYKRFFNNCLSKLLFMILRKKIVLLPQTIGPFEGKISLILAKYILNSVHTIMARDTLTYNELARWNINTYYDEYIDLAFSLPYSLPNPKVSERLKIGINVSGLLYRGGYNENNMFRLKMNYAKFVKMMIGKFRDQNDLKIYLIAHVYGENISLQEDDSISIKELAKSFDDGENIEISPPFKSPVEAKSYIAEMDLLIGSRMHACIAAFSAGVPIIGISYSRKFEGLFVNLLKYNYIIDARENDEIEALAKVNEYVNKLSELKEHCHASLEIITKQNRKIENKLLEILK
ncbi:MAG: polysaccharide pyruvyl transferase family protein [Melioribacteraceae bacterium]|nr:polysaccharide pyruvyl transferase family protein [Melioribacteraceae bacterium]MCF8263501.1 polysaccharide pyruvyl transferase family protein [Melioribacteraceae bacterium]MCF8296945.1 polysaccharide pyruvyl transferase family protein [Saprospiraceae bacterium]